MSGLLSGHSEDPVMYGAFMGFVLDDDSLISLRSWAERQGFPKAAVQQGGPDIFAQMLESAAPPKMAIVDIEGQADAAAVISRLANLCGGDCRLIAIGSENDIFLYRRILGAGAVDYLVKPLSQDLLNQALAAALRAPSAGKGENMQARLTLFIGARGGVGASTIALNVGWNLSHAYNKSAALFDMDLQFGTSSLSLDLEPGRGLRDIVSSPNRVDALMIASSIMPESDKFSILCAEEAVDELAPIDGAAIDALLKEMRSNFDAILIDLPRHMLASQKRLETMADEIVLVSDLTLAGIRDTLRIKNSLNNLGCTARITVVGARTNASAAGHVSKAIFEKGIQGTVDFIIPEDPAALMAASNSGKAIGAAAPHSELARSLRRLAAYLGNIEDQAVSKKQAARWTDIARKIKNLKIKRAARSKT